MLKLGLTGGIGSGKTTIAKVFENIGVPVFYADNEAKKFLFDEDVKRNLVSIFGDNVIDSNGEVNKQELASIVFNNKAHLQELNSLIHPLLMKEFEKWCNNNELEKNPYIVMEAAILFEAGFDKFVDKVLTISAPLHTRIERVVKRDNTDIKQVESRIRNQMSDKEREKKSDYIIYNGDMDMVVNEVVKINQNLL